MNLPLIDSTPISEQIAALAEIKKPVRTMVEVTILVPVEDIDFSQCTCTPEYDHHEMGGVDFVVCGHDIDLTGAKWMGEDVTFHDNDLEKVYRQIREERGIY